MSSIEFSPVKRSTRQESDQGNTSFDAFCLDNSVTQVTITIYYLLGIKRPLWDACLGMGDLQAPPAPHFVFLITL